MVGPPTQEGYPNPVSDPVGNCLLKIGCYPSLRRGRSSRISDSPDAALRGALLGGGHPPDLSSATVVLANEQGPDPGPRENRVPGDSSPLPTGRRDLVPPSCLLTRVLHRLWSPTNCPIVGGSGTEKLGGREVGEAVEKKEEKGRRNRGDTGQRTLLES